MSVGVVVGLVALGVALFVPTWDDGMHGHARDSSAKTDARNLVSMVEACFTDTADYTKCDNPSVFENTGLELGTDPREVVVVAGTPRSYRITATSISGNRYVISKHPDGSLTRTCRTTGVEGCPASGTW
ncbi:MAG: hypothetical protein J7513_14905 [Solirubrobacteraceae bacterium]|nr:hypothetical protein [Solirubrobacteraceae bacterium]